MSLHAGQERKLLRGQIVIAKVTLERTQGCHLYYGIPYGHLYYDIPAGYSIKIIKAYIPPGDLWLRCDR